MSYILGYLHKHILRQRISLNALNIIVHLDLILIKMGAVHWIYFLFYPWLYLLLLRRLQEHINQIKQFLTSICNQFRFLIYQITIAFVNRLGNSLVVDTRIRVMLNSDEISG